MSTELFLLFTATWEEWSICSPEDSIPSTGRESETVGGTIISTGWSIFLIKIIM